MFTSPNHYLGLGQGQGQGHVVVQREHPFLMACKHELTLNAFKLRFQFPMDSSGGRVKLQKLIKKNKDVSHTPLIISPKLKHNIDRCQICQHCQRCVTYENLVFMSLEVTSRNFKNSQSLVKEHVPRGFDSNGIDNSLMTLATIQQ